METFAVFYILRNILMVVAGEATTVLLSLFQLLMALLALLFKAGMPLNHLTRHDQAIQHTTCHDWL
ncbi:hypothetical protein QQ73_07280, partial [Candidatus Endoriftia persephone str. Guaymas]|nr:hypothetical protein [Candidatus Endoriftia persephone str. Guaymas]